MNHETVAVIAVFEVARDQEFELLQHLQRRYGGAPTSSRAYQELSYQLRRYLAAREVVEALVSYASVISEPAAPTTH